MQALTTIKLAGDAGVNFDLEPCDLAPDVFTSGMNYILRNSKIETFSGSTMVTNGPSSGFKNANIMFVHTDSSDFYVCMGNKQVTCFDGNIWSIIGTGTYSLMGPEDHFLWNYCKLGLIPIINNPQGYPQYWSPQSATVHVTNLPFSTTETWEQKAYRCNIIRAHKNFLFALGMYEGINYYPNNYRWSTAADNNGVPFTWDEMDLGGIAGTASILGNMGPIVDGLSMRDSFCIYCTDGITILDYEGGNYIWKARVLSSTIGLLTSNCIASINGAHIFLSRGDIYINDGNAIRSITDRRIKTKLRGLISSTQYDKSYCVVDERTREVWFCVPDADSTYPNVAIIYDATFDKVSIRNIDRPVAAMCYGSTFIKAAAWSIATDNWNTKKGNWNTDTASPFSQEIIGVEPIGSGVYNFGINDASSDDYTYLERVGAVFGDQRNNSTINRIYPHIQGSSPISIQVGSQDEVGSPTRWAPTVLFDPNTDRKVDLRTTGRLHSWRLSATDSIGFTFSGMDIEYVLNGYR